jgi:hypothetical protein
MVIKLYRFVCLTNTAYQLWQLYKITEQVFVIQNSIKMDAMTIISSRYSKTIRFHNKLSKNNQNLKKVNKALQAQQYEI